MIDTRTRLLAAFGALVLVLVVVDLVRRRKLKEEYSVLWVGAALVLLVLAVWYQLLGWITTAIGGVALSSTLFFFALLFIFFVLLHYSVRISLLERRLTALVQEAGLASIVAPLAPLAGGAGPAAPRIAVIIPCYDDGELLGEALASVREDEPIEVVVVDDGSSEPGTVATLERLDARGVRVVRRANGGLGAARMTGLAATRAPLVFPLDSDDRLEPGALAAMADTLDRAPEAAFAWGDYELFGAGRGRYRSPERWLPWTLTYVNPYPVCSMFRRVTLEESGGWQGRAYEDWDLWLRLAGLGRGGIRVDRVVYQRRLHEDPRLLTQARRRHQELYAEVRRRNAGVFAQRATLRGHERPAAWKRAAYPVLFGARKVIPISVEALLQRLMMRRGTGLPGVVPRGEGTLRSNILVSAANVVAVIGASLLAVPLLVDRLGIAGYGVWTLAQSLVIYVTSAELGFGPALARFTSVRRHDRVATRQVLVGALVVYAAVSVVIVVAFHLAASPIVDLFDLPVGLRADTETTVRLMGWVAVVALVAGALGHVLAGLERFEEFTASNAAGSLLFLAALAIGFAHGAQLQDAANAALLQWTLVAVLRIGALRGVLLARGTLLPGRALLKDLLRYSARLQAATVATLLNTQTDRVVVGLVASARTLGQVGVATQVAEAGRFLAYAAFTPVAARMAVRFGEGGELALAAELQRVRRVWTLAVLGAAAVGVGLARPAIAAWIGPGHDEAAGYAALLLFAYAIGLLPSPAFGYLRARGEPGLEGRFGLLTVGLNLGATVVLGVLLGATGVVAATTAAYVLSTVWVRRRLAQVVPEPLAGRGASVRLGAAVAAAAAVAYGAGQALDAALPRLLTLAGLLPVAAAALAAFALVALGLSPRAALRGVETTGRPAPGPAAP